VTQETKEPRELVEAQGEAPSEESRAALLRELETYYDRAPRHESTDVEDLGPLTLFVARSGWPYYARPRLGHLGTISAADVAAVLDRQRELDVPRSMEWVGEITPSLATAAAGAGMSVERYPLMVLLGQVTEPHPPALAEVRRLDADDPDLAMVIASVVLAFEHAGTAVGEAATSERDAAVVSGQPFLEPTRDAIRAGRTVQVGVTLPEHGPVGGGAHNPRGDISEVVGVGVLPAYRRRGLAAAVTATLAGDARSRGCLTVFCSAGSEDVARVYEGIGFRRVGTACIAEAG